MSGLPSSPPELRARTHLVARVEVDLPWKAERFSTVDLYDAAGLVEQLLVATPTLTLGEWHREGPELAEPVGLTVTVWNEARRFNQAFQVDPRGSIVRAYLYDPANPGDEELVFVGEVEHLGFTGPSLGLATFTVGAFRRILDAPFLHHPVTVERFPAIQPEPMETSGEGAKLADGWGPGLFVPLRYTRGPTFEAPAPVYEFACLGTCEVDDARSTATQPAYIQGDDYELDHAQRYPAEDQRAMTVLRFAQDVPPDGLVATVVRNHRDVDDTDLALWLFGGFRAGGTGIGGLADSLNGLLFVPGTLAEFGDSDATSGDLAAGPSEIGLAGIGPTTPAGYWTCDDAGAFQREVFTLEGRVQRQAASAIGPIFWSSGADHTGTDTVGGYGLRVAPTGELEFLVHFTGDPSPTVVLASPSALPVSSAWTKFAVTRDASGNMALRIGAAEVDTATNATAISYPSPDTPAVLGAVIASSAVSFWTKGLRLSGLRIGQTARMAADLDDDFYRMRESPVVALRDLFVGAGDTVDATAYAAALAAVDAFDDGGLKVGGWVSDESFDVQAVAGHLVKIVRAALVRTAAAALEILIPTAPTAAVATFGFYPESQFRNATHVSSDRQHVSEATKTLTTRYRLTRTATGNADSPQKERTKEPVLARGQDRDLDLRLVHNHRTAALIAGRERIDRKRRDERRVLEVQHEGIPARRGTVVKLDLGAELRRGHYDTALDYDPADYLGEELAPNDYEVLERILMPGHRKRLTLSPHDPDLYTPQPGTGIPVDAVLGPRPVLDVGTDPVVLLEQYADGTGRVYDSQGTLIEQGASGQRSATLRLALRSSVILAPLLADPSLIAPGATVNNGPVTGAATRAAALATDDGDGSYITLDDSWTFTETTQLVTFQDLPTLRGSITRFEIQARAKFLSGSGTVGWSTGLFMALVNRPPSLRWGDGRLRGVAGLTRNITAPGGYVSHAVDMLTAWNQTGPALRLSDIRAGDPAAPVPGDLRLRTAFNVPAGAVVRVTSLRGLLEVEQTTPSPELGGWLWYRTAPGDPNPLVGVTPPLGPLGFESTIVDDTIPGPGVGSDSFLYWVAVFDTRGRFSRFIGPQQVVLA